MNLVITIKTNQQIMELIKSKHNDESWPACAPKNDPEAKYYRQVDESHNPGMPGL